MLRVAVVGCGKIADHHVEAIRRIPEASVVAVCDREVLMARQLAERFSIGGCFQDVGEMLHASSPDVVHITTPPQSHHQLGHQCLAAGSHVYVEKPFTVTAAEAQSLIDTARSDGLYITAGHNYQFTPEMMAMRRVVNQGFLGGRPLHLESYWSYDLGDISYVGPLLGNPNHWVRQLPGQLFHNIISHGIARLAEFLEDEIVELVALSHQSAHLRNLGGQDVLDELRVMMRDRAGTTASFCFSTQIKPGLNQFRLCGPLNSITVDQTSGSLIKHRSRSYKSYLTFLIPPVVSALEHLRNARRNAIGIVRQRLHQDSGIKETIEQFYACITARTEPPIAYREILLTARIMDAIFAQTRAHAMSALAVDRDA
jgi:predicted dehydrogenase